MKDLNPTPVSAKPATAAKTVDVLIVGAGISGIGAAVHLQDQMPGQSIAIVDANAEFGGTWRIHTYPGIRSDSDLYTFGYRFKPWKGKPVADGDVILDYLREVIEENGLRDKIEYSTRVTKLSWSSAQGMWSAEIFKADTGETLTYRTKFLWMCQGYYDPSKGYTPTWPGFDSYEGTVIHPQTWPDDFDYTGKKILVIGSGATAATLVPNMADKAGHITMLQRSPTYFWTGANRSGLADFLRKLHAPEALTHKLVRWWILTQHKMVQRAAREKPEKVKKKLLDDIKALLPDGFDVDKHFSPRYRPWQQRLAYVPDGDLFHAVNGGKVSIVTDTIQTFTKDGVLTDGGEHLKADVIITATGFNLSVLGGIPFDLDGEPVDFSKRIAYRGMMFAGIPNMSFIFGYLRNSWTMRVDMLSDFVIKLLRRMEETGSDICTPTLGPDEQGMVAKPWIAEDDFNSGYFKRSAHLLPKQGDREPWLFNTDYYSERKVLPHLQADEKALVYSKL
jgi:cation diffusion facilitator CzcD-associated flavoprotein CzcO